MEDRSSVLNTWLESSEPRFSLACRSIEGTGGLLQSGPRSPKEPNVLQLGVCWQARGAQRARRCP
jgi:hypothetical protein